MVGDLDLSYEGLELPSDPGLVLFIYAAEPGSSSQQALDLLASWVTTLATEEADKRGTRDPQGSTRPGAP